MQSATDTVELESAVDAIPTNPGAIAARSKAEQALVLMYSGLPEPPTLNAILVLKDYVRDVVLFRNNVQFSVESYPSAPTLIEVGSAVDIASSRHKSAAWKLSRFAGYCASLARHLRRNTYAIVIVHDYLALLALSLVRPLVRHRAPIWFNSYDVIDRATSDVGRWSLLGWVIRRHERLFSEIDYFSIPARERMPHYPVHRVRRQSFVIPNYPSVAFYQQFSRPRRLRDHNTIRLLYQGALGRGHGFEQIVALLNRTIGGRPLELVLKGWIEDDYKRELREQAVRHGVDDRLVFPGFGSYRSVPQLASECTIGLAIFTGQDIMNTTLATASNKIFEYAAVGLPVVLYDVPHFRQHLDGRRWTFFTTLSEESLVRTLETVVERYDEAAAAAAADFRGEFNFERVFTPALRTVLEQIAV